MVTAVPFEALSSVKRTYAATTAGERSTLEAFLDLHRDVIVRKVSGLSEQDARRKLVASDTTLAGLVKHLRAVEMSWFQRVLDGVPDNELPLAIAWEEPGSSFLLEPDDSIDELVGAYQQQCDISRQVAARHQLSDVVSRPEVNEVSLRWIYVHMIHETAHHVGHADILREQIDGTTGP